MPLNKTCLLTLWNFIRQECCYIVDAKYIPAGQVSFRVASC